MADYRQDTVRSLYDQGLDNIVVTSVNEVLARDQKIAELQAHLDEARNQVDTLIQDLGNAQEQLDAARAQGERALDFISNALDGEPTDAGGRDDNGLLPVRDPDWLNAAYWRGQIELARETLADTSIRNQRNDS